MPIIIRDIPQGSDEWFSAKAGKPSASNFPKLITSKGEPSKSMPIYANLLAAELYSDAPLNDFEGNQWTDRGNELEGEARDKYEFLRDVSVEQVGYIMTDDEGVIASPDGLIGDSGIVEIKCLKTENHVSAILEHKKTAKCPVKYIQQTQGLMYVSNRSFCDLVFYHPSLPMLIIRQTPDKKVIDGLTSQIFEVRKLRDQTLRILQEL